ncbi:MAG TPA: FkbM family methyltransferase [Stellaceae bacterium]|nr:FkbM family methyltransferase [Stellaceae bacterium]
MSKKTVDPLALGADVARSYKQLAARKLANGIISLLGLNKAGFLSTEIAQAVDPIIEIPTRYGKLKCYAGHGRLRWRALTFHTEEPTTIPWLDSFKESDVFWDIGANVGLYSIYAAKFRKCRTVAFEPEAQNYALLMRNMVINELGTGCLRASCTAVTNKPGYGELQVRYLTLGGAYNLFHTADAAGRELPESFKAAGGTAESGFRQVNYGTSIDDLILNHGFPSPTHIKIDVDGNEPEIIDGCRRTLKLETLKSFLVEINKKSLRDLAIIDILKSHGFDVVSDYSVWDSKPERSREADVPASNIIFARA